MTEKKEKRRPAHYITDDLTEARIKDILKHTSINGKSNLIRMWAAGNHDQILEKMEREMKAKEEGWVDGN